MRASFFLQVGHLGLALLVPIDMVGGSWTWAGACACEAGAEDRRGEHVIGRLIVSVEGGGNLLMRVKFAEVQS